MQKKSGQRRSREIKGAAVVRFPSRCRRMGRVWQCAGRTGRIGACPEETSRISSRRAGRTTFRLASNREKGCLLRKASNAQEVNTARSESSELRCPLDCAKVEPRFSMASFFCSAAIRSLDAPKLFHGCFPTAYIRDRRIFNGLFPPTNPLFLLLARRRMPELPAESSSDRISSSVICATVLERLQRRCFIVHWFF